MSYKPSTIADLASFTEVIDARSPGEFAADHIPGAISCPVLNDEERRIVGTTYVQISAFEARKIGSAMVARNIAQHVEARFHDKPREWRPLVYCWRGGLRSSSFVTWLRLVGWDAQQLQGGYKAWRAHVIEVIAARVPALRMRVLCGPTGSAKTALLDALSRRGEQVLDLEDLAAHRGSVLGDVPGRTQPTQKAFETALAQKVISFDPARVVWVEAESRRIGRVTLPDPMLNGIRNADVFEIQAPLQARLARLLEDYAWLGDDPDGLAGKLGTLRELVPRDTLSQWQAWALQRRLPELLAALIELHYDPLYARSQGRHLLGMARAVRVEARELSAQGLAEVAARLTAQ
jgi:tRNA 2-selenouridine synthase